MATNETVISCNGQVIYYSTNDLGNYGHNTAGGSCNAVGVLAVIAVAVAAAGEGIMVVVVAIEILIS